ncbi:MAG: ABC transporter ATP-binding protein [Anaerolineaceae bacterium]|nr:ABC transporter ATP-binding protein [Anaerolineaceae bacterium]
MLLSIKDLVVAYGAIEALHGISFDVEEGEIATLIGANGAGKSTTLWSIVRQIKEMGGRVVSGSIQFKGEDMLKFAPHDIVNKLGITLVPEGRRVFGNLSVLENLKIAAYGRRDNKGIEEDFERVFSIFPRLEERKSQLADLLSGGEQQMLAVGRSLMNRGTLMLLDEPSMGLAPILVKELFENLAKINKEGTTILLVEQNAHLALRYATKAYVLETGTITLSGTSEEVEKNPEVKKAYLGT